MRIERPVRFELLGKRGYVHSTQIFAGFVGLLAELGPAREGVRTARLFKFIRETSRNGRYVVARQGEIDTRTAAATIAFEAGAAGELILAFIDDGDEAERGGPELASTISAVRHEGDFSGRVRVGGAQAPRQLFIDLIEANKALHNATLVRKPADEPPPYRFVYAENVPVAGLDHDLELVFRPRDVRNRGGQTFTLAEITIAGVTQSAPIRICFSY